MIKYSKQQPARFRKCIELIKEALRDRITCQSRSRYLKNVSHYQDSDDDNFFIRKRKNYAQNLNRNKQIIFPWIISLVYYEKTCTMLINGW